MRSQLLFGLALSLMTGLIQARQPTSRHTAIREVIFNGCHFKITDPYNGTLEATKRSSPQLANYNAIINSKAQRPFETWIQFFCEKQKADDAFFELGMKRSGKNWEIVKERTIPEAHAAIYQLHNPKWTGALATSDQTFGDPEDRVRDAGFCIAGARQVLCGTSEQVMYLAHPKESTLPQVIKLLESIEFIDPPAKQAAPAGSVSP